MLNRKGKRDVFANNGPLTLCRPVSISYANTQSGHSKLGDKRRASVLAVHILHAPEFDPRKIPLNRFWG